MKISKLLEYQEVEREYQKLNRDVSTSPEAKAFTLSRQHVTEAIDSLVKLDRMAGELMANFDKNIALFKTNQDKTKEFKKVIKDVDDLTEIDYVQKKLDELISECNSLTKDINAIKDKINYIRVKTNEASKLGKESQDRFRDAKTAYDKLKNEKNPEAQAIVEKLNGLEKEINNENVMTRLKRLLSNNIRPAVVKCENTVCMGCGMNIASNLHSKMKSCEELIDCPNCGRLMYSGEIE